MRAKKMLYSVVALSSGNCLPEEMTAVSTCALVSEPAGLRACSSIRASFQASIELFRELGFSRFGYSRSFGFFLRGDPAQFALELGDVQLEAFDPNSLGGSPLRDIHIDQ